MIKKLTREYLLVQMLLDQLTGKGTLTCKIERDKESVNGSQQSIKYPVKKGVNKCYQII